MLIDPTSGTGYANGQRLTSADMTTIATQQPDAVDGVGGGTYAPTAPIIIGGSGIEITGATELADALVNGGLTVTGATQLNGTTQIDGDATLTGATTIDALDADFTAIPGLASQTITRVQPLLAMPDAAGSSAAIPGMWYFDFNDESGLFGWRVTDATTGTSKIIFGLSRLPDLTSLTALRIYVKGTAFTTLPSSMPVVKVFYVDENGAKQTLVASAVDTSANVTAFNLYHAITPSFSPQTVNHDTLPRDYYVLVSYAATGSAGAGRTFHTLRIEADFTVTKLSAG